VDPLPGCLETLRGLAEEGYRLGIATAGSRDLPQLDRWGVRDLFSAWVGREDVARRKPDPECVELCLSALGCVPEEAVYVGDSPVDVAAGIASGTATVGVLTGTSDRQTLQDAGAGLVLGSASEIAGVLSLAGGRSSAGSG
jgi:HAD superfamily hydrolase (TIGR01509 family)